ncbi:tyrosine-type recombinase/integrase [Micrococcus luteus]|uniref:tyrosine-type recombinase/integrase n=1 Tax=Micrococcus luteus TaxID=1270 RepID=UPI0034C65022
MRDSTPVFLDEAFRRATRDTPQSALLWPAIEGGHLRRGNARDGWFATAVCRVRAADRIAAAEAKAVGREAPRTIPQITPHKLRNSAASLAISTEANVKGVQRMLGHASATMARDKYADLFDDDLHRFADALDEQRRLHLEQ